MTGKDMRGFTLIELMVVLLVISILAAIVAPMVVESIGKARESALKENLYILRKTLDNYYADRGHYPMALEQLAEEGYLRKLPVDPLNDNNDDSWELTRDDEGGISDVHSAYEGEARDGSSIRDW